MRQNKYEYDAFISHAVEDKIPIANELCAKLERAGLRIWYSGKELGIGDSIEKTIERGLNRSRYGIVIFSPTYLAKNWTIREFYTLLAKEIEEQKVILPVLYNITLDELKNKDLVMADRFAVNADRGIDFVVDRLVSEIKRSQPVKQKEAWFSKIWLVLVLSLLANVTMLLKGTVFPGQQPVVIPAHLDEPGFSPNNASSHTLLGEMEGLFRRINSCSCDQREHPSSVYKTDFVQNRDPTAPQITESFDQRPENENRAPRQRRNKMTMAVVFQIETPARTQPDLDSQMDQLLNTISLREKGGPFLQVSNSDRTEDLHPGECLHTSHLAD